MRRTALAAAAALSLAATAVAGGATAAPAPLAPTILDPAKYCPSGPIVVDVTYAVANAADVGARGAVWATDAYTRQLQIVRTGKSTYCAGTRDNGTFTSLGGESPGGASLVGAGIVGAFNGGLRSTVFSASWRPQRPTSGFLGTFDGQLDWVSAYFGNVRSFGLARWIWNYDAEAAGYWSSTYVGSFGDIAG